MLKFNNFPPSEPEDISFDQIERVRHLDPAECVSLGEYTGRILVANMSDQAEVLRPALVGLADKLELSQRVGFWLGANRGVAPLELYEPLQPISINEEQM